MMATKKKTQPVKDDPRHAPESGEPTEIKGETECPEVSQPGQPAPEKKEDRPERDETE